MKNLKLQPAVESQFYGYCENLFDGINQINVICTKMSSSLHEFLSEGEITYGMGDDSAIYFDISHPNSNEEVNVVCDFHFHKMNNSVALPNSLDEGSPLEVSLDFIDPESRVTFLSRQVSLAPAVTNALLQLIKTFQQ